MSATQPSARSSTGSRREALLEAATRLFREQGFVATTVDEICAAAGVTKGAFFHHFDSKETVAEQCLLRWKLGFGLMLARSPAARIDDPFEKLMATLDVIIETLSDPQQLRSCLAGTTVQECSATHPRLRDAANDCFDALRGHLQSLMDEVCRSRRLKRDTAALAVLWIAAMQGTLVVFKASQDAGVIPTSLRHVRGYIASQFEKKPPATRHRTKR